ncbi:HNH endonuclease [Photobacterium kishitanii]|uniref:HNH endonuclease n=1 Tax=Photobacterium kishitanii TaxID=318456 RepID=UPI0015E756D6|nr:HNH endonuclease signature motif containing protein [Photobacterium kishitanii]
MFNTVVELKQINKCQSVLLENLSASLQLSGNFNIGFPGGSWNETIKFNDEIWFHHFEIADDATSPRYWNGFGLAQNLSNNKSNNIVVEINIPTNGINRRVAGFFAENEMGEIGLFHRGGLGGGRKGVGKQAFLRWSSYELTPVLTDGINETAILVGLIESDNFPAKLYQFLLNIEGFKQLATSGEINEATYISDEELLERILNENPKQNRPKKSTSETTGYERSEFVKEFALRKANGECQLCRKDGPFKTKSGRNFLEVHHIDWLSKGGLDIPKNVIALCPNCHRTMHYVNNQKDIEKLKSTAYEQAL